VCLKLEPVCLHVGSSYEENELPTRARRGWTILTSRGTKRERVLRVLLSDPDGSLSKLRIAKLSECSRQWIIEFLAKLETQGLVEQTRVLSYSRLVEYWGQVRLEPKQRDYMLREPLELLRKTEPNYALTTYQAENLVQRYLFPSRTDLYFREEDGAEWHSLILGEGGLVGRGNLRLLLADPHVFYKASKLEGLAIVSLPQLAVDLLAEGGPCVEAAQLLLEKVSKHTIPAA